MTPPRLLMPGSLLVLLAALQSVSVSVGQRQPTDSARRAAIRDSIRAELAIERRDRDRRPVRRVPVTPDLERSAFRDEGARSLLLRARAARFEQDSTLQGYDASAYQRLSTGLGFRAIGRDRLLFRTENAARVRWSRQSGLHVQVKGNRTVFPMVEKEAGEVNMGDMGPVPYYPGREELWLGSGMARAEVDENELIHPIATGAEAYYRYAIGDSLVITLSDGAAITLRELRVEPRRPEWRLSVGSFWFDAATGRLVRAAYRFSAPMNIWAVAEEEIERERAEDRAAGRKPDDDEPPGWVKGMFSPMEANLEAVTIDYGLYGGRYWLPRTQTATGYAHASFMRIPFKLEESFKYASVNGRDSLPSVLKERTFRETLDSLFAGDTTRWVDLPDSIRAQRRAIVARADSVRREARDQRRTAECATGSTWRRIESRFDGTVQATVEMPCDTAVLSRALELPASIYEPGEALFGTSDRDELLKALDFSLQPGWAPAPIVLDYGIARTRYNRVEGLSTAVHASQALGRGLQWDASLRAGTAEPAPFVELGVARTNGRVQYRAGAYRRLGVVNDDWGSPLSFGASLGAALFGRDEGFYYRATGFQLERSNTAGGNLSVRGFLERQRSIATGTSFSIARSFGGNVEFGPNIDALPVDVAGIAVRDQLQHGLDPRGWRIYSDIRLEGGALLTRPDSSDASAAYGRAAADMTISHGVGRNAAIALTLSAGRSTGAPVQRHFFLGGAQTIRGQVAGAQSGDTYWMTRLEAGTAVGPVRPVLFGDVGWAGPWDALRTPGRPLSSVGAGLSFMDGLIRMDLARGIYPRERFRFNTYVEARF